MSRSIVRLLASLAMLLPATQSLAGPVADKNLEAAIRLVLQEPKAELTDEKLQNVFLPSGIYKPQNDGLAACLATPRKLIAHKEPIADRAETDRGQEYVTNKAILRCSRRIGNKSIPASGCTERAASSGQPRQR